MGARCRAPVVAMVLQYFWCVDVCVCANQTLSSWHVVWVLSSSRLHGNVIPTHPFQTHGHPLNSPLVLRMQLIKNIYCKAGRVYFLWENHLQFTPPNWPLSFVACAHPLNYAMCIIVPPIHLSAHPYGSLGLSCLVFLFGFALVGLQRLLILPLFGGVDVGVLGQVLSQSYGWSRSFLCCMRVGGGTGLWFQCAVCRSMTGLFGAFLTWSMSRLGNKFYHYWE